MKGACLWIGRYNQSRKGTMPYVKRNIHGSRGEKFFVLCIYILCYSHDAAPAAIPETNSYRDERCFKPRWYYVQVSNRDSPKPNCYEGVWLPCTNCSFYNMCQIQSCTLQSDAVCDPKLSANSTLCREAKAAHGDENCFKAGYTYIQTSTFDLDHPNCHSGMWQRCRNCTSMGLCFMKSCSSRSDAVCGACETPKDSSGNKDLNYTSQHTPSSGPQNIKLINVTTNIPLTTGRRKVNHGRNQKSQESSKTSWLPRLLSILPFLLVALMIFIIHRRT